MSPLIKIPFIFASTYGVTASLTNPNPSITDDERRPDDSKTSLYMYFITKYIAYFRNIFWLAAAAETMTILLADGNSTSPDVTYHVLQILIPSGRVTNLRLTPISIVGFLLVVAGSWLRLRCFRTLREFFTFEITIRGHHKLITNGPYSYVRHPSYTGSAVILIGLFCWFGSSGSWVRESGILETVAGKAFIGIYLAIYIKLIVSLLQRMPEEDKLMKASFGKEWEDWAHNVPYWLIPGIY